MDPNMDSTSCQLQRSKLLTANPAKRGAQLRKPRDLNPASSVSIRDRMLKRCHKGCSSPSGCRSPIIVPGWPRKRFWPRASSGRGRPFGFVMERLSAAGVLQVLTSLSIFRSFSWLGVGFSKSPSLTRAKRRKACFHYLWDENKCLT